MLTILPTLKKALIKQSLYLLLFFLALFLLNTASASARTLCYVDNCQQAQCSGNPQPNTWAGNAVYSDQDNCAVQPYSVIWEYFADKDCTVFGTNPCPAGCTDSSECNGGVCANRDSPPEEVCFGIEPPGGSKFCRGALCGYKCDSTSPTFCGQVLPPDGFGPYTNLTQCSAACAPPPTSTPTPTNTPTPSPTQPPASPTYRCTDGQGKTGYCGTTNKNFHPSALPSCSSQDLIRSPSGDSSCPSGSIYDSCYICGSVPQCQTCFGGDGYCGGAGIGGAADLSVCQVSCPSGWEYKGQDTCNPNSATPYCFVCNTPVSPPPVTGTPTPSPTPVICNPSAQCNRVSDIGNCRPIACDGTGTCIGTCRYLDGSGDTQQYNVYNQVQVTECQSQAGTVDNPRWSPSQTNLCRGSTTYNISGNVFVDSDLDGRKDTGEANYEGARLSIGAQTATTDRSGNYRFTGLSAGTHSVELDIPFGYSPQGFNKASLTIPPDGTANFPLRPYSVHGFVYTTNSRTCDTSITSSGVKIGQAVNLTETFFSIPFSTTTDGNGKYAFEESQGTTLFEGDFSLDAPPPADGELACVVDGTTYTTTLPKTLTLTASSPVKTLNLYYNFVFPWFQGVGGDMRIDGGFYNPIPQVLETFASLKESGNDTPGVIFSGNNNFRFCSGTGSTCIEKSSEERWVVGGTSYPETFTSAIPGTTRTSYSYLLGITKRNGVNPQTLPSDCQAPSGCNLGPLTGGLYKQSGNLYLRQSTIGASDSRHFVILVDGDVYIQDRISINRGSTLIVSASGKIYVDQSVGGPPSSPSSHVEGFYSADSDFVICGRDGCDRQTSCLSDDEGDQRLNMEGSVVVNANYSSGALRNRRDLCDNNRDDPSLVIKERPDMILNAPAYIKHPSFIWQEVAP